jgi:hypothetical protein
LRCFDGDGRVLWALRDAELRAILDGGCLVDSPERGELRRVDDKGEVADRIRGSFTEVDRFGDRVVLLTEKGKVRIIDLALKRVGGFRSGFRYLSPFICAAAGTSTRPWAKERSGKSAKERSAESISAGGVRRDSWGVNRANASRLRANHRQLGPSGVDRDGGGTDPVARAR